MRLKQVHTQVSTYIHRKGREICGKIHIWPILLKSSLMYHHIQCIWGILHLTLMYSFQSLVIYGTWRVLITYQLLRHSFSVLDVCGCWFTLILELLLVLKLGLSTSISTITLLNYENNVVVCVLCVLMHQLKGISLFPAVWKSDPLLRIRPVFTVQ